MHLTIVTNKYILMVSVYTTFLIVNIVKILVLFIHVTLFSWKIPTNRWSGNFSKIINNFQPQIKSDDRFCVDFILHPLTGMLYYRSYKVLTPDLKYPYPELMVIFESITWEFLYEVWWWQPSVTDLFITPIAGIIVGRYLYSPFNRISNVQRLKNS